MKQEYTGNNCTRHLDQHYLFIKFELTKYSCRYYVKQTWPPLHSPYNQFSLPPQRFYAVCKSTVNPAFLRLQSKRTRIQKMQQGTKNEDEWKKSRQHQTKQWLIILNQLPEDKE